MRTEKGTPFRWRPGVNAVFSEEDLRPEGRMGIAQSEWPEEGQREREDR